MQAFVIFASVLAVTSAGIVSLHPVTYVAEPLPIYNQVQNTRTGEYAYNYAGGPSAKEEIKTSDGVVRGAYNYIDAHGIVQSAQYIADDAGFRIAATNIPTDAQVGINVPYETPDVQLAKAAHFAEHAKAIAALGRKKRSLQYASVPTAVSSQYHNQEHESVKIETPLYQQYAAQAVPLTYGSPAVHVPVVSSYAVSSIPTSVSHQSRFQVHKNSKLELSAPVYAHPVDSVAVVPNVANEVNDIVEINSEPAVAAVQSVHAAPAVALQAATPYAVASVPTAVSNQRRFQVHNSQKLEVHSPVYSGFTGIQSDHVEVPSVAVDAVPAVVDADSVAVEGLRAAPLQVAAAPAYVSSVPTAVSSQSRSQIHNSARIEVQSPVHAHPSLPYAYAQSPWLNSYGYPVTSEVVADAAVVPFAANAVHNVATAVSSQSRAQVHSSQKVEVAGPLFTSANFVGVADVPQDTPEVAAAKAAHAEAYAAELVKHQGW